MERIYDTTNDDIKFPIVEFRKQGKITASEMETYVCKTEPAIIRYHKAYSETYVEKATMHRSPRSAILLP